MELQKIQTELKARVAKGLNFGIEGLEDVLDPASGSYNDFILLKSKYNDLMYISSMNTLPYEQIEIGMDRLRGNALILIDKLEEDELKGKSVKSDLKVQALPTRRTNFFKLLDIHFQNLAAVRYMETFGENEDLYEGREAIFKWYQLHRRGLRNKATRKDGAGVSEVRQYFSDYFRNEAGLLEVYFKNIKHLIAYALESEIEQAFFLDTLQSLFSRYEIAMIFYYVLSDIDPVFSDLARKSHLLEEVDRNILIEPEHWELLMV
jgi:hypothetical protein